MSWNYRIVKYKDGSGYGLHEVYYDDEGRPWGMTAEPIDFTCAEDEGPAGVRHSLSLAVIDAHRLDVLDEPEKWPGKAP